MPSDLGLLTLASVLRRGRQLDHLSSSITIIALAWGLLQWPMGFGTRVGSALATLLVLVGVLQKIWAMRVALDADLFDALGRGDADGDASDPRSGAERRGDGASGDGACGDGASGDAASGDGDLEKTRQASASSLSARLATRLAAMDAMLVGTGLMPARLAGRPLAPRTHGALRLLVVQAAIVGFQVALTLSSLLAMPWLFPAY
ncbi:hypothetical protein [Pigmentiphaga litoralis]|uniref:Uncharacterized protein n=1 Tax=Pigmentiphaga litoralis TaxID=516702 RepID=A0A7Y9LPF4_9BURK|nr:hypothetical protein [Pigmentiphaga litoralis]NYE22444.1 hypothetical protein [Pigmentiphaga litoralis]NYE83941.1 hypothetical protein [Pigmentiphaga litoralis]